MTTAFDTNCLFRPTRGARRPVEGLGPDPAEADGRR